MILKLFGMGLNLYCKDNFNILDGVIVILSTIEVIFLYSSTLRVLSGGVISVFRAFRLLRVFKLAGKWEKMRELLNIIGRSMGDINYFVILLLLFITIYTLLGMELFAHRIKLDDNGNVNSNG